MLIKRVFKIAIDKWNYGIPFNAFNGLESPHLTNQELDDLLSNELSTLISNAENKETNTSPLSFNLQ